MNRLIASFFALCLFSINLVIAQDETTPQCVPASIMFHSADRGMLINELIPWLTENGYETVTYLDLAGSLQGETTVPEKSVILSIDDVDTIGINQYFFDMVDALHEADMVAVLGVNDRLPVEEAPEAYDQLKLWADWGFELATHTSNHSNLPTYGRAGIEAEVADSVNRIELGTGIRPITLILPYGAGAGDERIFEVSAEAGIEFVVGIAGMERYLTKFGLATFVPRVGTLDDFQAQVWEIEHWGRFNPECR